MFEVDKEVAVADLKDTVEKFNERFKEWREATKCEANIGWNYQDGKALEVVEITAPIYRKPVATMEQARSLKDVLKTKPE